MPLANKVTIYLYCYAFLTIKYPVAVWSLMNNIPQLHNRKSIPCHQLQKA